MTSGSQPPREGMPAWLKAILIVVGILVGIAVLAFGLCVALLSTGTF